MVIRRWDAERSRFDTVARIGGPSAVEPRSVVSAEQREQVFAWAVRGRAEVWPAHPESTVTRCTLPRGLSGPAIAGPLRSGDQLVGVLLIGTADGEGRAVVQEALEPFSVALANDTRLQELARLREAAEQDRTALLSRLGRQYVSDAIVGAERGLKAVMERVAQVAPTDAPVLILGETGSGKEVVARSIHSQSRRASGPFLRVNCGAIPTELVDSELFGHEKGSFTGAIGHRKGWFERADGGTLFLDEVGGLPAAAQVRLLRVLQDGTFERVGGQQTHSVDVRIVAATHRDMTMMVRDGHFRQDLWYRVSVFPITLPALRERRGDIPALTRHFAERAGIRLFSRALEATPADIERLSNYDWPGNVRELAAVIERAAILGNGQRLQVEPALGVVGVVGAVGGSGSPRPVGAEPDDRASIEAALQRCHGRIEGPFGAADALGVNPHTLRSRMRRLGIEWSRFRGTR
jgi:transcriptional regulator with GAF, ATPase, and Fis domain